MVLRVGAEQDIPAMCQIRKQQLIDEGIAPDSDIDSELHRYFTEKIANGSLVEWLVEENGRVIATAAIAFIEFPPSYNNPSGIRGYITNMYTAPDRRGEGIASMMLNKLTEEAKKRGVHRIWLSASSLGKPVYKRFGFEEADRCMELNL